MGKGKIFGAFQLSSIANTLALLLFVIIFVTFAALGTVMYTYTRGMIVTQQELMVQTKTQAIVDQLDAYFKHGFGK